MIFDSCTLAGRWQESQNCQVINTLCLAIRIVFGGLLQLLHEGNGHSFHFTTALLFCDIMHHDNALVNTKTKNIPAKIKSTRSERLGGGRNTDISEFFLRYHYSSASTQYQSGLLLSIPLQPNNLNTPFL